MRVLQHTPTFLAYAHRRAMEAGDAGLAAHYALKDAEEEGHAKWAEHDIEEAQLLRRRHVRTAAPSPHGPSR